MYSFGVVGKLAVRSRLGGLFRGFLLFGFVVFLWMLVASGLVFLCSGAGGHGERERETDRPTDRQTDRQTDGETHRERGQKRLAVFVLECS